MSGSLGNLLIKLTADTGQATSDIGKAAHQIERDMQNMAIKATAAGVAIGAAVTVSAAALAKAGAEAIQYGDQLAKMSMRSSVAVERLSEIAFAGKLADVSMSQIGTAMSQLNKTMVDAEKDGSKAQRMFKALGVDITRGPQVAFEQLAKSVNALPDGESKVAALRVVFGRSGDALLPLITGLDEATQKARELGLTVSTKMAQDSEKFNDSMTTLNAALGKFKVEIVGSALPSLTKFINEMVEGTRIAGGFGNALALLGGINPFRSVGGNIQNIQGEIASLEAARGRYKQSNADTSAIDQSIAGLKKQEEFLKFQQRQEALALGGGDTPGERARMAGLTSRSSVKSIYDNVGRKIGKDDNLLGRQLQEDADEWAKIMSEAAGASDKFNQTLRDQEAAAVAAGIAGEVARADAIIQMQELLDAQTLLNNGFDEQGRKIGDAAKKASDYGRELGLRFSSAFEDAILKGEKFSEVLRGIGNDILRIVARKTVTDPIANMVGGGLDQFFASIFGGGKAMGGPVSGGTPYLVGERGPELFVPGASGSIVPNHAMGGAPVFNVDMRGASMEAVQELRRLVMQVNGSIEPRAVAAVTDRNRRGGISRSMG